MEHRVEYRPFQSYITLFLLLAPVIGWGRYETFEYGCTLAFHDPSLNLRSYVVFALFTMFTIPLGM